MLEERNVILLEFLPWLTANIDFKGLSIKATQIMIVQTLMLDPVIQNMKRVMKICFDGDLANSQAFYEYKMWYTKESLHSQ